MHCMCTSSHDIQQHGLVGAAEIAAAAAPPTWLFSEQQQNFSISPQCVYSFPEEFSSKHRTWMIYPTVKLTQRFKSQHILKHGTNILLDGRTVK